MGVYEIIHYLDENGNDLYQDWLDGLRDRIAKIAVIRRVDVGAGYRVYYAQVGTQVILLTSGGDKKSQSRDIDRAVGFLKDWEKRNG